MLIAGHALDRARHIYLIGASGTGKSSLLVSMASQELAEGSGLAFIDPHGDTARALLDCIPAGRVRETIYFNPADHAYPIGFNPLECAHPLRRAAVADNVVSAFKHAFADSWGPRLEHFLLNACRTLLEQESRTLLGIPKLFLDERYRRACLRNVDDPMTRMFWELEYPTYSERLLSDALSPIFNKINRALSSPELRNVFCQPKSTIDIRHIMDEGQILIVNLSKGRLGEGNASLMGCLLTSAIAQAALGREDVAADERKPFALYVDEFQNFATGSFADILSEARKYRLSLTLAHQFLAQVPEGLRKAAIANCANFITLRVGAEDAPLIAQHLGWKNPQTLTDLPDYRAFAKFLQNGKTSNILQLALEKMPDTVSHAEQIIRRSRNERGRQRTVVEARIRRFLEGTKKPVGGKVKSRREQAAGSLTNVELQACAYIRPMPPGATRPRTPTKPRAHSISFDAQHVGQLVPVRWVAMAAIRSCHRQKPSRIFPPPLMYMQ